MVTFRRPRTNPRDSMLAVWTNGERVGTWSVAGGEHRFQYEESWITSPSGRSFRAGAKARSTCWPPSAATAWAPSSYCRWTRRRKGYDRIQAVPLDEAGVERAIDSAVSGARVLGQQGHEDSRIAIAGAQEKTALLSHGGTWCRPLGATPTTHIFKLPLGLVGHMRADMHASVENEWLCGRLMSLLGFAAAPSAMASFGRRKVLVVERFDRILEQPPGKPAWLARVPQEDFCQALGVASAKKYESDGGPGVRDILRILDTSTHAAQDKLTFVQAQLAFWLMAATDGHAKNFSIFLQRGGGYRLTPLYDVLSAWPIIGNGPNQVSPRRAKLSMALRSKNVHYHLHEINTRHWQALAAQSGVPDAFDRMVALVLLVPDALEQAEALLPAGFPRPVFNAIRRGMLAQAEKFVTGLP